jgi:hypothetical protein
MQGTFTGKLAAVRKDGSSRVVPFCSIKLKNLLSKITVQSSHIELYVRYVISVIIKENIRGVIHYEYLVLNLILLAFYTIQVGFLPPKQHVFYLYFPLVFPQFSLETWIP